VSRVARQCGVKVLGVSCLEEAIDLRRNFIRGEILILGALPESQICDLLNYDLTPTICTPEFGKALSRQALRLKKRVRAHICVDTGDGRVGPYYPDALHHIKQMIKLKNISIQGLYSHFATADAQSPVFALKQKKRFEQVLKMLEQSNISIPCLHLANSGGILNVPDSSYNIVRPGLLIYGIYPCQYKAEHVKVKNVFSFKTRIVFKKTVPKGFTVGYGKKYVTKKKTDIITLPIGYADGFPRQFSNKGEVIIRKKKLPVVGSVCMDMIMVDAGRDSGIRIGDEAVIIGKQGKEEISVYDIASNLNTIPYEVICNIGKRVTRVYIKKGEIFSVKRMISEF
jgi:alanine racemase